MNNSGQILPRLQTGDQHVEKFSALPLRRGANDYWVKGSFDYRDHVGRIESVPREAAVTKLA